MNASSATADIGLIGLAVMGENLILNMENHGNTVAVFNRTTSKVDSFVNGRGKGKKIVGCRTRRGAGRRAEAPAQDHDHGQGGAAGRRRDRRARAAARAGRHPHRRRQHPLPRHDPAHPCPEGRGILFIGTGVSGGEEGALKGPSIMPGGNPEAWPHVKPIFQAIAAKVEDGTPCCDWVGPEGAGHYVKMVHNGIEYGDMQLICEAYQLMRTLLGMEPKAMHDVFARWNTGPLDSYLIEITRDILGFTDPESGKPMVDLILDAAGQKGTGKWTVISALDLGVALTLIAEAVFARCLSAQKEERVAASKVLRGPTPAYSGDPQALIDDIEMALYASKIISYAQGYALMDAMAKESNWEINNGGVALMWRGGCIIRSAFLGKIKEAFDRNPKLSNLLLDPYFTSEMTRAQDGWRRVCAAAAKRNPGPGHELGTLLLRWLPQRARLPANLLQAQRDFFGAHTYERIDRPRGQFFHTNWTGRGGTTSSSSYNV